MSFPKTNKILTLKQKKHRKDFQIEVNYFNKIITTVA